MKWITIVEPRCRGFNVRRKFWHAAGLSVPLLLYSNAFAFLDPSDDLMTRRTILYLLILINVLLVALEVARISSARFRVFFHRTFGFLMKEQEEHSLLGTDSYMIGALILFLFFSNEIIILSILFLVLGDPLAALVGIYFGRLSFPNGKTLEGMLAFAVTAFLSGLVFLALNTLLGRASPPFSFSAPRAVPLVVILGIASLVAALAEIFSFTGLKGLIDDNLNVPLSAAISLGVLCILSGFPVDAVFYRGYLLI